MQTTLKNTVTLRGVGLHTGRAARVTLRPAPAHFGIWFKRTDAVTGDNFIAARWDNAVAAALCTQLQNADGVSISTIEHLMAALAGCGVHNVTVEVSGPELPILDGSSAPFVSAILKAGIQELDAPVRALKVTKTVEVRDGAAMARFEPAEGLEIDFEIDFPASAIGQQARRLNMANGAFVRELCDSRTFCLQSDVADMHSKGLALGGSVHNAVVVDGDKILSPGGLRHWDEPVRHKMLDALGDLALAGAPVLGRYVGRRAGHTLTNKLLRAVFADPTAFQMVDCDPVMSRRLPGTGLTTADLAAVA